MLAEIERFVNWVRRRSPNAHTWQDYRCDLTLFPAIGRGSSARQDHLSGYRPLHRPAVRERLQTHHHQPPPGLHRRPVCLSHARR